MFAGLRFKREGVWQWLFCLGIFLFGVWVSSRIVFSPHGYVLFALLGFVVFGLVWRDQRVWLFLVILLTTFRAFDNTLMEGFLSWSQVLTGLVLLVYIIRLFSGSASLSFSFPFLVPLGLILLWSLASGLWVMDRGSWFHEIISWGRLFILFWLINSLFIEDEGGLKWGIYSLIIGTTLNSVIGAYVVLFNPGWVENLAFRFYGGVSRGEVLGIGEIWTFYGFNMNNSGLALMLCYGIFFLVSVLQGWGLRRSLRLVLFIGLIFQVFLLVNTFSRTGWVAFCVGFLFLLFRFRFRLVVLVLSVLVGFLYLYGPLVLAKWSVLPEQAGGYSGRLPELRAGLEVFLSSPLFGLGLGGYPEVVEFRSFLVGGVVAPRAVHNTYLKFLVELGIVGFVLMVWVVLDLVRVYRRNSRMVSGSKGLSLLNRGFGACLFASAVYAFSQGIFSFNLFWILLALYGVFSGRLNRRGEVFVSG